MNRCLELSKLVIFDMDGTILNSEPIHARAIQVVFKELGVEMTVEQILKRYTGWGDDNVYKDKTEVNEKVTREEFLNQKNQLIKNIIEETSYEDFQELFAKDFFKFLDYLKEKKVLCSLVSASERDTVDLFLNKAKILEKFDFTLTRDEVFKSKPSPACYFEAMRKLEKKSEETIIFEDSDHGIRSALGTGSKVFAINFDLEGTEAVKTVDNQQLQVNGNYSWLFSDN